MEAEVSKERVSLTQRRTKGQHKYGCRSEQRTCLHHTASSKRARKTRCAILIMFGSIAAKLNVVRSLWKWLWHKGNSVLRTCRAYFYVDCM